jgi:hypothetical protein
MCLSESEVSPVEVLSRRGVWTDREYAPAAPSVRKAGEEFARGNQSGTLPAMFGREDMPSR